MRIGAWDPRISKGVGKGERVGWSVQGIAAEQYLSQETTVSSRGSALQGSGKSVLAHSRSGQPEPTCRGKERKGKAGR